MEKESRLNMTDKSSWEGIETSQGEKGSYLWLMRNYPGYYTEEYIQRQIKEYKERHNLTDEEYKNMIQERLDRDSKLIDKLLKN